MSCNTNDTGIYNQSTIDRIAQIFTRLTHETVQRKGGFATWDDFPKDDFTKLIMDKIGDAKPDGAGLEEPFYKVVSLGKIKLNKGHLEFLALGDTLLNIARPVGFVFFPKQDVSISFYAPNDDILSKLIASGWVEEADEADKNLVKEFLTEIGVC